ncbi:hypothetical protein AcW1_001025 [Taiwanofungus camphoratus]|nr:hypothetical protein AcW1_001025 [Antrodia cinnamomea]
MTTMPIILPWSSRTLSCPRMEAVYHHQLIIRRHYRLQLRSTSLMRTISPSSRLRTLRASMPHSLAVPLSLVRCMQTPPLEAPVSDLSLQLVQPAQDAPSPFQRFRSWKKLLSVSDLVGPAWCEVQFDYGLRQKRSLRPDKRPASFVTAEGKSINVDKRVAEDNHRIITRGKSVHKALEREIHPEEVKVDVTSEEERWGLRLVNMLASLTTLTEIGTCREMPVFGIIHDQIIVGVIDELVRKPRKPSKDTHSLVADTSAQRTPNKRSSPSTSAKAKSKRSRRTPSPSQQQITSFLTAVTQVSGAETADAVDLIDPIKYPLAIPRATTVTLHEDISPSSAKHIPSYTIHLSDTKTRRNPSLPPHEDTFQSRLQLMIYHRLLSALLVPSGPLYAPPQIGAGSSSELRLPHPVDFGLLWTRLGVEPGKPFSEGFMRQVGLLVTKNTDRELVNGFSEHSRSSAPISCLNDLTNAWAQAVAALEVIGVDRVLTIVYRMQPSKSTRQTKAKSPDARSRGKAARADEPLSDQEAQDIARAVHASLNEVPCVYEGGDEAMERAIAESLKESIESGGVINGDLGLLAESSRWQVSESDVGSSLTSDTVSNEPGSESLAKSLDANWLLQQTYLEHTSAENLVENLLSSVGEAVREPVQEVIRTPSPAPHYENNDGEEAPASTAKLGTQAQVLGRKRFVVDEELLDRYLDSVLQWWHGQRPPRGVGVELTRRCMSCEYREGCEWRERKALEACDRPPDGV